MKLEQIRENELKIKRGCRRDETELYGVVQNVDNRYDML